MTGCLVLIVGPSGAGKDTLLTHAKRRLRHAGHVVFPRRVITRPVDDSEDFISTGEVEFGMRLGQGDFSLSWRAHGLWYGVPRSIEHELARGKTVVVNVSRQVLPQARAAFDCFVIEITAPAALLRARLLQRGRENAEAIAARLARDVACDADVSIRNDGGIEDGAARLAALIMAGRLNPPSRDDRIMAPPD